MKTGWRLGVLGIIFVGMFTLLFVRLWFVQVAASAEYERQAQNRLVDIESIPAPRGLMVDRSGRALVTSVFVPHVLVDRSKVPAVDEDRLVQQLSGLLSIPALEIWTKFEAAGSGALVDLGGVDTDTAYYIWEHRSDLIGVRIVETPERRYPLGAVAGHIVGYTGKPSAEQLQADPELDPNAAVGKGGLEAAYDTYLQGTPGFEAFRVNARGSILEELQGREPVIGNSLHLNIDLDLQQVTEQALRDAIDLANQIKRQSGSYNGLARRGAIVVLDPRNGDVLSMAAVPAFDPALLREVTSRQLQALVDSDEFSYNDLAIAGQYPPASTFKAVTYVAAAEEDMWPEGVTGPEDRTECSAQLKAPFSDGSQQVWRNWTYPRDDGYLNLHEAFARSCNVYFWEVALDIWNTYKGTDREDLLQQWARDLGFGSKTGIDLPGEQDGLVPDRALFERYKQLQLENPDIGLLAEDRLTTASPWFGGDLLQMAVGQGSMLATPLQLAVAYSALVNGGTVWEPHVVARITDPEGNDVLQVVPTAVRQVPLHPETVQMLRDDMRRVTTVGTAASAFAPMGSAAARVGGKTGTAQMPKVCAVRDANDKCLQYRDSDRTSWFVGAAPIDDPRYVVVVMVDEGGGGSQVAAPAARFLFQYLLGLDTTEIVAGDRNEY